MRQKIILILLLLLVISLYYGVAEEDKVDSEVYDEINDNGEAKVIVMLKDGDVSTGFSVLSAEEITTQNVLEDFNENEINVTHEYDIIKGFAGEINEEGLEKLENDPRVEKVFIDKVYTADLASSLPLINATKVHGKFINSLNITGANQTICIIDTGINANLTEFNGKLADEHCFCSLNEGGTGACCLNGASEHAGNGSGQDNNGHGSHVAGIALGNGSVKGVAPGAFLVTIKVLNSSGSGSSSDIVAGINYCNNNRTILNISVISMSLGGGGYSSEASCNSGDATASASNSVHENIFVVASSGNSGSTSLISGPACATNVTAVGALNDDYTIWSGTDRNSLLDLIAPGVNIDSSNYLGGTTPKTGTSMAAPHVAGAGALLMQYKKQENGTIIDRYYVKNILSNSGISVSDSGTGLTFKGVDLTAAIIAADVKNPNANLTLNNIKFDTNDLNVTINFTSLDTNLDTSRINVTYPNGSLMFTSSNNVTLSSFNYTLNGNYTVVLFANDSNGNLNITTKYFEVTPYVLLIAPVNYYNTSSNNLTFNFTTIDDLNITNVTLFSNHTGNFSANKTLFFNLSSAVNNFTLNNLADGNYIWNVQTTDNDSSQVYYFQNYTFTVDTTSPLVYLVSPANNTNQTSSSSVTFTYNVTEFNIANCSLIVDGSTNQVDTSITPSTSQSFTASLTSGSYYSWSVSCFDYVGNSNSSVTYRVNVSVTTTTTTTSGSSGNGGGSAGGAASSSSSETTTTTTTLAGETATNGETVTKEKIYEITEKTVKDLTDNNAELKKALEDLKEKVDDLKVASQNTAGISRKIDSGDGITSVTTKFNFKGLNAEKVLMYDEVPKIFADHSDKIIIEMNKGNYTIVNPDPIYLFTFENVNANEDYEVKYLLTENTPASLLDVFESPLLFYRGGEEVESSLETPGQITSDALGYWWVGVLVIIVILVAYLIRLKKGSENKPEI